MAIHGDTDPIPCEETFDFLKTDIRNINTFIIKDAGHFPWLEETSKEEFLKVVTKNL